MENQELLFKASIIEKQSQELSENIEYISKQLEEMDNFHKSLKFFESSKEKQILASIGKGIFLPAELAEKKFLVNVGAEILVKKTPEETIKIVESKLKELFELKTRLSAQLELYNNILAQTIAEIEKSKHAEEKKK